MHALTLTWKSDFLSHLYMGPSENWLPINKIVLASPSANARRYNSRGVHRVFAKTHAYPSANCEANFRKLKLRERLSLKGIPVSHNCSDGSMSLNPRIVTLYGIIYKLHLYINTMLKKMMIAVSIKQKILYKYTVLNTSRIFCFYYGDFI